MPWHLEVLPSARGDQYVPDRMLLPDMQLFLCSGFIYGHGVWTLGRHSKDTHAGLCLHLEPCAMLLCHRPQGHVVPEAAEQTNLHIFVLMK